ncbi:ubiquitin-conjugating enzyme, partial [Trifolium medium]|nr:ubiquitin-conjugating enzyme [Trifolium medium]
MDTLRIRHVQTVFHDVIDLEGDDDLVVLGETSRKSKRNKGKAVETIHGGYGDHQVVAQFDNVDLPTGIEAPFTLLPEYGSKMGNSSLQIKTDNVDRFSGTKAAPNKNKSSESHRFGLDLSAKKGSSSSSSFHSCFVGQNGSLYPQGIESKNPWLNSSYNFDPPFEHGHGKSATAGHNGASVASPGLTTITDEPKNETLMKFQNFKQFDTVDDASDHHFVHKNSSTKQ